MNKTICLVDDTPDLLLNFSDFLQMEGFEVWPCNNGWDALKRMETAIPDLIITDLWMPAMDGLYFIEQVRANPRTTQLPVVIFSAKPFSDYQEKAASLGVTCHIKKPAALEEILRVVTPLLSV